MERRYAIPHVVEIRPHAECRTAPPDVHRPTQRALVQASLLRRPPR
jgi:hypothetical protein